MLTKERYKSDPCGTLSIPYHKSKGLKLPKGILIVHDKDFDPAAFGGYADTPYFRLMHGLSDIPAPDEAVFAVSTAGEEDIPLIADVINRSYADIGITRERLLSMRLSAVFDPALWVIACEKSSGLPAACGIAELDRETGEGALEWIQTLPGFRRRGAGKRVVLELLSRLSGKAEFATVSGRAKGPDSPENFYRACGFTGNDIWHVLVKG
jgi:ribosomal protein S18 acetylase RimI-like enzyme